jgi:chemosensory pili system protein ChpA (sensor histidine kinase/response regulator)
VSNRDLLLALADELAQGEELLRQSTGFLADTGIPEEFVVVAAEDYRAFTARVSGVAEAVNLDSLRTLVAWIDANLSEFIKSSKEIREDENLLLLMQQWPARLSAFLKDTENDAVTDGLRQFLSDEHWLLKLDESQFDSLASGVRAFSVSEEKTSLHVDEDELLEPSVADVSVSIPDDISPKLLATFQQELPQTTAELSQRIQKLFNKSATGEDLSDARRVAHTLKGAANIVGVPGIANVTHFLEDILESLVNRSALPSSELSEVLIEAADCLEMMSEAALGVSEPPEQALDVLNSLLDWRHRFANDQVENLEPIPVQDSAADVNENQRDAKEEAAADVKPEQVSRARKQSDIFDKLLDIAGELSSTGLLTTGQLQAAVKNTESLARMHARLRTNMILLQDMVFSRSLKKSIFSSQFDGSAQRHFDPLEMDQYNELHSIANLMTELMDDIGDVSKAIMGQHAQMRELLSQQDQLNKELDQSITAERLVSINTILPRLQRSVRQTCRMLDKKAELAVTGDSVSIDSAILDAVIDPLLHMLRNAVDHGVESPEERLVSGKLEQSTISLDFERVGNNFVIRCKDDGRGIDTAAVKRKAIDMGLIEAEQILSKNDLHELILLPGFSTKHDADQISGRGVGMDVVTKNITDQRGSISIRSEEGQGTEIIITVPQTLLKMHVVLLHSGEFRFGVLSNSFNQIVSIGKDLVMSEEKKVDFNDQIYDVKNLSELLGIPKHQTHLHDLNPVAILVDDEGNRSATFIDDALGSGELVIKKIGRFVPRIGGIVGTVLTEDGAAVPVFDIKELLRRPSQIVADYLLRQVDQATPSVASILIVDDSSSARRSMSQVVRDAGYDVRTAIDGIEAISLIEERIPDLVLTDLEMPKMNGLELTAHLRAAESTRNLPIVMVTSRSTEKHKSQAISTGVNRYITKPFTNDDLVYEMHQLLLH